MRISLAWRHTLMMSSLYLGKVPFERRTRFYSSDTSTYHRLSWIAVVLDPLKTYREDVITGFIRRLIRHICPAQYVTVSQLQSASDDHTWIAKSIYETAVRYSAVVVFLSSALISFIMRTNVS